MLLAFQWQQPGPAPALQPENPELRPCRGLESKFHLHLFTQSLDPDSSFRSHYEVSCSLSVCSVCLDFWEISLLKIRIDYTTILYIEPGAPGFRWIQQRHAHTCGLPLWSASLPGPPLLLQFSPRFSLCHKPLHMCPHANTSLCVFWLSPVCDALMSELSTCLS